MKIILYTIDCPMCKQLERQLTLKGIEYERCDDQDKMRAMGLTHTPMLDVDGEMMDFAAAIKWIRTK